MNKLAAIAGVLAVVAFLWWSNQRSDAAAVAMQRYEECVQREYNTTPGRWYAEHGELPVCEVIEK